MAPGIFGVARAKEILTLAEADAFQAISNDAKAGSHDKVNRGRFSPMTAGPVQAGFQLPVPFMFNIAFLKRKPAQLRSDAAADAPRSQMSEWESAIGQITIGSFQERFESPLGYWQMVDYEGSWQGCVRRMIDGAPKTALFTAMYDPAHANFLTWWPLYREGEIVFIQNHLLFIETLTMPFSIEAMDDIVPKRERVSEDGDDISEWQITFADLVAFSKRGN